MDVPPALTKKLSLPEDAFIVSSQHGSISHCTIWVVAMDFSDLSFRSLRLAGKLAKMRKNTLMDHFICLNVVPKGESTERAPAFATCVEELRKCGASPFHIHSKTLELKEGWTISSTLVYYANHAHLVSSTASVCLVLGAAGTTNEQHDEGLADRDRSNDKHASLGGVASFCLATSKVPVLMAKMPWTIRPKWSSSREEREGRNGKPGLTIAVCVTDHHVSKTAFDMACGLCRPEDTLIAVHVITESSSAVANRYKGECEKIQATGHVACASVTMAPTTKADMANGGLAGTILRLVDAADVIVMGSVELNNAANRKVLGSIAVAIAKDKMAPHLMIVKSL